jgi:hypothetical protein
VQFLKVIEIEPMNPRGYTGAAEAYLALGYADKSKGVLEKGLAVLPNNDEIITALTFRNLEDTPQDDNQDVDSNSIPTQRPDVALSEEQLAFLSTLEAAITTYDMETAFPILASLEFQELCRNLPKENGNVYKYDGSGEWMLVYHLQTEVVGENFGISLVDDWENGRRLFAESYLRDDKINGGTMMTYDIVDGVVSDRFYNAIGVEVMDDGGFRTYQYEPNE